MTRAAKRRAAVGGAIGAAFGGALGWLAAVLTDRPRWLGVTAGALGGGFVGANVGVSIVPPRQRQLTGWLDDDDDPETVKAMAAYEASKSPAQRAAEADAQAAQAAIERARKVDDRHDAYPNVETQRAFDVAAEAYRKAAASTRAAGDRMGVADTYTKLAESYADQAQRRAPKKDPPVKWAATAPVQPGATVKRLPWKGTSFPKQQRGEVLALVEFKDNNNKLVRGARVRFTSDTDPRGSVYTFAEIAPVGASAPAKRARR